MNRMPFAEHQTLSSNTSTTQQAYPICLPMVQWYKQKLDMKIHMTISKQLFRSEQFSVTRDGFGLDVHTNLTFVQFEKIINLCLSFHNSITV